MADNKQDHLNILIKVKNNPKVTQRELAKGLGISLGKLNYCLRELQRKGLLKLKNFQKKDNKFKYFRYVITPKGIAERTKLTINFMQRKMREYDELKKELEDK